MVSWRSTALATSVAFGALLLAGCAGKPALPSFGVVPHFTLTDQTGAAFSSAAALNKKIWVADFVFTNCPGPCPRMSSQMHQVQTALAGDAGVRFVSFTVDPARDTPPVLAAYARHFEAAPGKWFFLTGAAPDLNRMSRGVFMLGDVDGSLEHSTRFALVDGLSRIRGYYQSSEPDAIPHLIADAKRLLRESL
jgi:protein SCO1/2